MDSNWTVLRSSLLHEGARILLVNVLHKPYLQPIAVRMADQIKTKRLELETHYKNLLDVQMNSIDGAPSRTD